MRNDCNLIPPTRDSLVRPSLWGDEPSIHCANRTICSPMTRHIDFDGIENFRDFGGYDTSHGRPLKRGLLYRSANHAYASDADLERMRGLGLAAIIDLRRAAERAREPSKR